MITTKRIKIDGTDYDIDWEVIKDMEKIIDGKLKGRAFTFRISKYYDGLKSGGKTKSYTDDEYKEAYNLSLTDLNTAAESL